MTATAGAKFRESFETEFEVTYDLEGILDAVVGTLDLIERLAADVDERGLTVTGSQGQEVANASLRELRAQRLALPRLLKELGIEDESDASSGARAMNAVRYGRQRPTLSRKRRPS